jgi:hypothetical protein
MPPISRAIAGPIYLIVRACLREVILAGYDLIALMAFHYSGG